MQYVSTKTFGHEIGLSCCFRQWRATHSHCQYLHGYALAVHLEFEASRLDERNWVVDFGDLGEVRDWLKKNFDHRTIVAVDDPELETLRTLEKRGLAQLTIMQDVGCEKFAEYIASYVRAWLASNDRYRNRVSLRRVRVSEHGANGAEWIG
jgi:6-pyruvoyltetrahydropterin/6-carboxytetrahydropterin synthase